MSEKCPECDREFDKLVGLAHHRRDAHGVPGSWRRGSESYLAHRRAIKRREREANLALGLTTKGAPRKERQLSDSPRNIATRERMRRRRAELRATASQ